MNKRQREVKAMFRRAGLVIIKTGSTGSGHISVTAEAPNGVSRKFSISRTVSDYRGDKNQEQQLIRFAQENQAPGPIEQAVQEAMPPLPQPEPPITVTLPAELMPATPIHPTKPEIMSTPKQTPKYTKHQTSHAEFYRLCEWIKTADLSGVHTYTAAAQLASKHVGFPVPVTAIQNAMEATGVKLPEPPQKQPRDRTQIVARELANLLRELGKEPSEDLLSIIGRAGV